MTRRGLITSALTVALVSAAAPAWASAAPRSKTSRSDREPGRYRGAFGFPVPSYQTTVPGESVETFRSDLPVAPGIVLTSFHTFGSSGWLRCHVLNADLSERTVGVDVLSTAVTNQQTVSQAAATRGALAAVNGDYFDITETNAPEGPLLSDGKLEKATDAQTLLPTIGVDRIARFADLMLDGTVTVDGTALPMNDLNTAAVPANGITVFTPEWGSGERTTIPASGTVVELIVSGGQVTASNSSITTAAVPTGGLIVVGSGAAAAKLAGAKAVSISFAPKTDSPAALKAALGSGDVLIKAGAIPDFGTDLSVTEPKPRTAIGWLDGGKRVLLVAVDGSANFSAGVSFADMAATMQRLGATDAFMLDGGGSTELVSRHPGDSAVAVVNTPSDGNERLVSGSVGLFGARGSGRLHGLDLRPQADRVVPGLTMDVAAAGYDETWSPVSVDSRKVSWSSVPGDLGRTSNGVFRAKDSGAGELTARSGSASGTYPLRVVGALHRLQFSQSSLTIESGATASVTLVGLDADGFDSPIHARDVTLSYDTSVLTVTVESDGSLSITSTAAVGTSAIITAAAQSISVQLAVTVGLANSSLEEWDTDDGWTALSAQGTTSVALVPAPERPGASESNQAIQLTYDFTGFGGTSAAYAVTPTPITLPIGTKRLSLWVNGDGQGHWLRAMIYSQGTTNVPFTFADVVDWVGWRQVVGDIPDGFSDPVELRRVYIAETSQTNKNAGQLEFDSLTALVGQDATIDVPPQPDPYVLEQQPLPVAGRWNFAVLSDLHISAAQGLDSFSGHQAVIALQQVVAAKPDFILINGDFVDNNNVEDFQMADTMLSTYVPADLPVYWTPGNHEAGLSATGGLDAFLSVTGRPNRQVVDHKGTRFILLDSHTGDMRTSDWSQVPDLQAELDKAATDRSVTSVVVSFHHPLEDPTGAASSQLSDQLQAELFGQWLADFRENSGKPIALFTGHAHDAAVSRADGVLLVTTPAVGKTPYASPDQGGFFGWMHVAVDARPAKVVPGLPSPQTREWLVAESHPLIDKIALTAPATLAVGSSTAVSASGFTTEFGLEFPLRFPASVVWGGASGLVVAETATQLAAARVRPGVLALLDLTGADASLQALRAGTVTLTVASGGLTASADIALA